ncbi:DNA primase [Derxia gummosa]|uniref:DNA primase n=1 Tax=Derxia gummosa DSM 723 TaxID=1121388 RepID=A0A8B6X6B7_9BURK|nr:DNA primase [Derxia gummosa]
MISQSFIADLLDRVDIVDVVGQYVKLRKGGANFSGLCPFHSEKSPSFTVSPTKQFYHCFGCGAHGSALGFIMEFSGLTFPEAVEDLAGRVGMQVVREDGGLPPAEIAKRKSEAVSLTDFLAKAADFYRKQLRASPKAIDYLRQRGLTGEIAKRFGLGYAPDAWDSLRDAFDSYDAKELVSAGLVIDKEAENGERAKRYDRFRDRVMFPIRNPRGAVIGFGGRVIGKGEPKYLNSPETPVFQKGNELYGLFEAREAIRERGYVLVVEGYMDVVALAQSGIGNAVATLGTACTPVHVQKLLRQVDRVVFSFDGDRAGRKAAWRALEASLPHAGDDKLLSFLFLPSEHDPDTFVRERGAEAFEAEVASAMPLSAFLLQELTADCDLRTAEGRSRLMSSAKPLIGQVAGAALRTQLGNELAKLAQIETGAAMNELGVSRWQQRPAPPRAARAPVASLEQKLLLLLARHPALAREMSTDDEAILLAGSPIEESLRLLIQLARAGHGHVTTATIHAQLQQFDPPAELRAAVDAELPDGATDAGGDSQDSPEEDPEAQLARTELAEGLARLRLNRVESEIQQLIAQGSGMDMSQFRELQAERIKLRSGNREISGA